MTEQDFLRTSEHAPECSDHVLLAIDTAIGTAVAVGAYGRVVTVSSDDPMAHAEVVGSLIAEALDAAGVRATEVTGVVAGMGPGPFTGLRVGIAAAQAFARGRGQEVLPLLGHEAVALEALEAGASTVTVLQDARRKELFLSEFTGCDADGIPVPLAEPRLTLRLDTEAALPEDAVWPARIPVGALVRLAARRLRSGRGFAADQAVYLRAPDVRQPGAPKRVRT